MRWRSSNTVRASRASWLVGLLLAGLIASAALAVETEWYECFECTDGPCHWAFPGCSNESGTAPNEEEYASVKTTVFPQTFPDRGDLDKDAQVSVNTDVRCIYFTFYSRANCQGTPVWGENHDSHACWEDREGCFYYYYP